MTANALETALNRLTDIQREAVEWGQGALLVLAGPGSGKTQILTCRIARLLEGSRDDNFHVLALTFTTKAADEMRSRVQEFVPGLEERSSIGTFHSFCTQVLRQHGVHLGIRPDFTVYALDADRRAILEDALRLSQQKGQPVSADDSKYLPLIDRFKARLLEPDTVESARLGLTDAARAARIYRLYEEQLRRINALDFNSMIFEVYRLATKFPAIAARYQRSHPYWLIDEFQDTNEAQYRLISALAGTTFQNVFAVADDDQIIYQWNGASFRQLRNFTANFAASVLQLPTNFRCPPIIVQSANRLVAYNAQRAAAKKPLVAAKTDLRLPPDRHLRVVHFSEEGEEYSAIARDIAALGKQSWGAVAVLARTRSLLDPLHEALQRARVQSCVAQRRDDFVSPEFRWAVGILQQAARPLDERNFGVLVESFNRIATMELSPDQLIAAAQLSGKAYLDQWVTSVKEQGISDGPKALLDSLRLLAAGAGYQQFIKRFLEIVQARMNVEGDGDLSDDASAWAEITREITRHMGRDLPLEQFLQELGLRSKEPGPKKDSVTLMTIHAAKGREFDFVYLIGMAEDIIPSFQSRKRGDKSPEMEEERRNCFVAITRTKESLTLSWADRYRGYPKQPSRFLKEMELN